MDLMNSMSKHRSFLKSVYLFIYFVIYLLNFIQTRDSCSRCLELPQSVSESHGKPEEVLLDGSFFISILILHKKIKIIKGLQDKSPVEQPLLQLTHLQVQSSRGYSADNPILLTSGSDRFKISTPTYRSSFNMLSQLT